MDERSEKIQISPPVYQALLKNKSELTDQIRKIIFAHAFENRSTLHPRRLKEIINDEADRFFDFLSTRDALTAEEHGRRRLREGLGSRTILALGDLFRNICWQEMPAKEADCLQAGLQAVESYMSSYLKGYLEEHEASILKDQEELRRALSAALVRQGRELHIKNHAINTSINGIMLTDLEGRAAYVNPAFLTIWGFDQTEELVGRNSREFFQDEEVWTSIRSLIERKVGGGRRELIARRRDGARFYVDISASLIKDASGQPIGVMVSFIDITERKQAEQDLKKLEEHLFQSQKMEAVGTLASGIAHDFNNILQAISGYIQLVLTKGRLDHLNQRYLLEASLAVDRASDLINRLLTFSRRVKPELKPVDLNQVVDHAVKMLERALPKMIRIEVRLAEDLELVNGDANQLEQVVMNLGTNARDAMPEGGRLVIETGNVILDRMSCKDLPEMKPGRYVLLQVTDTGCGMDAETVKHIFEPFFTTKNIGEGTGLGLSTVYGIVKGHGGHITCTSEKGQGAVFKILLPVVQTYDVEAVPETRAMEEIRGGSETILLADDERAILEVARDALQEYGYNILLAENGEQVLDIYQVRGEEIDLVILDLSMPGMGGQRCLQELCRINPQVKVIIASGYSADGQKKLSLDNGAVGFLPKPYRLKDMVRTVREVLDAD